MAQGCATLAVGQRLSSMSSADISCREPVEQLNDSAARVMVARKIHHIFKENTMGHKRSSVRMAAIVFGGALFTIGAVLSLSNASLTAQAKTGVNLNTLADSAVTGPSDMLPDF
jgi:hypothetical protein